MKAEFKLVLFLCNLFAWSVAQIDFSDDNVEEDLRYVGFDQVQSLRQLVYGNGKNRRDTDDDFDDWKGRWMPDKPGDPTPPPKVFPKMEEDLVRGLLEPIYGVPMGHPSPNCDDAKTNLTIDWDGSPTNYTCYGKKLMPNIETIPLKYCEQIPKSYVATHKCMQERIEYDDDIPLFGPHRPLWPVYGEYKFLPKQRWIHSLEHGAIVALYHPCANPLEVKHLTSLVTSCLRRHVISPYDMLSEDRPLALVSWGCRLTMSYVNHKVVTAFIREHALRGPEAIARDGDFDEALLRPAKLVSDFEDTTLCPANSA
ncbi:uncharacterized protein LOC128878902 [Hylaeus volcanicus]|uniref:uncharacterized protein LOC128878902 n=1 Tax=Hylaeus volcanicus TaxID=313075 RepID=UPI0023B7B05B|nr:uncharacterized protein LOC128878902 [Hylaeus volcanicus]